MKRILFVDDELQVLEGLRNILRKQRRNWDMVFAQGAQAALVELEKLSFDVIVSDMRMPGMDGASLLQHVKEKHPGAARIILSGQADRDTVVKALSVAHQFLDKPCDAEVLRVVVERACDLQILLQDEGIRRIVGGLEKLPSVPRTYWELTRAVNRPQSSIADIARIVESDPAMSAKVLQLVNSAYFGLAQRMTSIHHAVAYLGMELLKGLALTAHVFGTMEATPVEDFSLDRLQQYSLQTAKLSRLFSSDPKRAEEAFTAALVHDIGKIVVALGLPARFPEIVCAARTTGRPLHVVEKELIGVTHAEIGAYLLGVWGLPLPIVEAVAHHHNPGVVGDGACDVLAVVHVADALVDTACSGEKDAPVDGKLDMAFLERAGVVRELPRWRAIAEEQLRA